MLNAKYPQAVSDVVGALYSARSFSGWSLYPPFVPMHGIGPDADTIGWE